MFKNKTILITGGTGSFGQACIKFLVKNHNLKKIIIFSRDENKQYEMNKRFPQSNIRFFLGDIRDRERLTMAMKDVDYVIHAAALKHVPIGEYNPIEFIKTNVYGAQNIITAAIDAKVEKVLALSTDKATNPINLYGASKLAAEKLFIAANNMVGKQHTKFSVVRYGNVLSSRGSIVPLFINLIKQKNNIFPLTDEKMTRFFINLPEAIKFVLSCLQNMTRGEIFVPKMPSFKISDLAKTLNSKVKFKIIGIRPGEKLHEILISDNESRDTFESKNYYIIASKILDQDYKKIKKKFKKVRSDFIYQSNVNKDFYNNKNKIKNLLINSKIINKKS